MSELAEFISVAQAAEELRITERAVRHRIKAGKLAATKLGPGTSQYVITRAEVERLKAEAAA
jgi:excisionase family DNA binding protein